MRFAALGLLLALLPLAAAAGDDRTACLTGSGSESIEACRRAIKRGDVDFALAAADALDRRRQHKHSVEILQEAQKRFPGDPRLATRLAVAHSNVEEQAFLQGQKPAGEGVASVVAAVRCTRLSGADALAACDQALAAKPGDPALHTARGDALAALNRTGDAAEAYRAALRVSPDDAATRRKLAALGGDAKPADGLEQQLSVLARLRDDRLITPQEFETRRRGLLDRQFGGAAPSAAPGKAAPSADKSAAVPAIDFGDYHALVIGIDAYQHLPRLETAVRDAEGVAAVLRDSYGFKVTLLTNANRAAIIEALDELRDRLGPRDNLLVYYAGHGWLDKEAEQGFWLPVDARPDRRANWVSNDTMRDAAKALQAKHVLVVADSCFSGTLTRGFTVPPKVDAGYLKRIAGKKARLALSSGGLEPVADSGGSGHSPFAKAFMDALRENAGVLDGTTLFGQLRRPVVVNAEQTPEYSDIRRAGHDGGDFLFVRRK